MEDTELPQTTVEPSTGGSSWISRLVAGAALLTSLVSIFLGIQNGNSMNRLVEANSWPHPSVRSSNYSEGARRIDVEVVNQGVGPVLLHDFVVLYEGEPVSNAVDLVEACCLGDRGAFTSVDDFENYVGRIGTYTPSGRVIRPGEEVPVFNLDYTEENAEVWEQINRIRFGPLTFRGCFCSVFDECWESDMVSLDKTPVASCTTSEEAWRG